ncbi:hypothetical protein GLYMA_02G158150v4 [Glycine max]|nr:hypothetical protein GLYMA_02G158150v4 [Glycine max]KAH1060565.1 hypothetical protein GYH30_004163 [Glycine max]
MVILTHSIVYFFLLKNVNLLIFFNEKDSNSHVSLSLFRHQISLIAPLTHSIVELIWNYWLCTPIKVL